RNSRRHPRSRGGVETGRLFDRRGRRQHHRQRASTLPTGAATADADQLLAAYGLDWTDDVVELIDYLDRLGDSERPQDLVASVRPDQLDAVSRFRSAAKNWPLTVGHLPASLRYTP